MKHFDRQCGCDQMAVMGKMETYGQNRDIWVIPIRFADGFDIKGDEELS